MLPDMLPILLQDYETREDLRMQLTRDKMIAELIKGKHKAYVGSHKTYALRDMCLVRSNICLVPQQSSYPWSAACSSPPASRNPPAIMLAAYQAAWEMYFLLHVQSSFYTCRCCLSPTACCVGHSLFIQSSLDTYLNPQSGLN